MPPAPESSISRRDLLRVGGGGALAVVIGVAAGILDRRDGTSSDAEAAPSTTASPTTTAAPTTTLEPVEVPEVGLVDAGLVALGERVIEVTGEDDLDTLLRALPSPDDVGTSDPVAAAATVTRAEFAAGDTVVVDGWVLAVSEARASAVLALLCRDGAC